MEYLLKIDVEKSKKENKIIYQEIEEHLFIPEGEQLPYNP